jgi:protein-S-isoprenylcysteine O-methyltransferase Ste14
MNNFYHWIIVVAIASIKVFVCSILISTGDLLAILYAVSEFVSLAYGVNNAVIKKDVDSSAYSILIPFCYLVSSFVVPHGGEPGVLLISVFSLLLAVQVWFYISLGSSYTMGVSTWSGLVDSGPYKIIRHPQLALQLLRRFVFIVGFPSLFNFYTGFVMLISVFIIVAVEEKYCMRFTDYKRYYKRVPFKLIPGVW